MNYDLLVLTHPKDYVKLQYCLNSCMEFLNPKPDNIYMVSPNEIVCDKITYIPDDKAIPVTKDQIKYRRANWIWKMLVNLFQDFTENDFYLTVDADVIFNRRQELFIDDKPVFFISDREQCHKPYFDFMDKWSGMERITDYTFINDFMMFDKKVCREMLPSLDAMVDFCNQNLSEDCLLADYEIYGNYVSWAYPDMYEAVFTKTQLNGKAAHIPWTPDEIESLITRNRITNLDLFTIHSWT